MEQVIIIRLTTLLEWVPDDSAHDGFGIRQWMVRPSRFGPCRQMVRPISLKTVLLLNSAMVDLAQFKVDLTKNGKL